MTAARRFAAELDAWEAEGRVADFWWRDDDAAAVTPAFRRLLAARERAGAPLAVATVPAFAQPELAAAAADSPELRFLQHGYAHADRAPAGEKKSELASARGPAPALADLRKGRRRMAVVFGKRWLDDVLVPPWNRISDDVAAALPELGFRRLSLTGPRRPEDADSGVVRVNVHVDIVDWRGGRGYVGDEAAFGGLAAHLEARRRGACDPDEATGILTHHLVHDEACWSFVAGVVEAIGGHPAARWRDIGES